MKNILVIEHALSIVSNQCERECEGECGRECECGCLPFVDTHETVSQAVMKAQTVPRIHKHLRASIRMRKRKADEMRASVFKVLGDKHWRKKITNNPNIQQHGCSNSCVFPSLLCLCFGVLQEYVCSSP